MPSDERGRGRDQSRQTPCGQKLQSPDSSQEDEEEIVEILEVVGVDETTGTIPEEAPPLSPQATAPPGEGGDHGARSEELRAAIDQVERYKDLLIRQKADFENLRKRSARQASEIRSQASADLVARLLPVLDNVQRALQASAGSAGPLKEGVILTHQQLLEILAKEGLAPIDTVGKVFDPALHEAVEMVHGEGVGQVTVVEEILKGYTFKERLLRPALVKVASGRKPGDSGSGTDPAA